MANVEPPYHLSISDKRGNKVDEYVPGEIYTVRLSGTVPFKAFLMQARLATNEGFLIGHLRAGRFLPDPLWEGYGLRTLEECLPHQMNALTNVNFKDKYIMEAKWTVSGNVGAIQFILTIFQEHALYWERWTPSTGFLKPAPKKDPLKLSEDKSTGDNDGDKLFVNQPPPAVPQVSAPQPTVTQVVIESAPVTVQSSETELEITSTEGDIIIGTEPSENVEQSESDKMMENMGDDDTPTIKFKPLREKEGIVKETTITTEIIQTTTEINPTTALNTSDVPVKPVKLVGKGLTNLDGVDTVMTAVLDPRTNRVVEFALPLTDYCASSPCSNGGTCTELPEDDTFQCHCPSDFTGQRCENVNHCHKHKCLNGGICQNRDDDYTCRCLGRWAGNRCQRGDNAGKCPRDQCKNGGTCILDENDAFACSCKPGYTGEHCENELNECAANPCRNGGVCEDKFNSFNCKCSDGFMGDTCHRPCQDIYKSCARWRKEDRCESMRTLTKFFDVNCAVTCQTCDFVNKTVRTHLPLAPILEPFHFLIGQWRANFTRNLRHPVDFSEEVESYEELLEFAVAEVPMFGTPSINYTARATSHTNPDDQFVTYGFLTLNGRSPKDRPTEVALLTTSTDGVTLVEEGTLESETTILLRAKYAVKHPDALGTVYKLETAERMFVLAGPWLQENVNRETPDGRKVTYTKYFSRVRRQLPY